ncbi:MAG: DUF6089 family protein [Bacteroidota bacterium]
MYKFLILFFLIPFSSMSQRVDIDVFGGMANYQGDLQAQFFTFKNTKAAYAMMVKYGITNKIYIRTGLSFASLAAFDANNLEKNRPRNLDFQTKLQEYSLGLEYRFINPENFKVTPYVFVAGGVFHYNSYTIYNIGGKMEKVYLKPLSTEGQGLAAYPERKPYALTQFCVPYGAGIKWQLNCNLNVGIELRQTKTFTDYIDDVSTSYVDQDALRDARGQVAVDLAFREDEFNGKPYPSTDQPRGNPVQGDLFYFAGVTVGLKLNNCDDGSFSLGGLFGGERSLFRRSGSGSSQSKRIRNQLGCPKF